MINSNEREVNTNNKENSERYVSLKSSSYFNSDRQQNFNSDIDTKTLLITPAAFMNSFHEAILLSNMRKAKRMARTNASSKPKSDDQIKYAEIAKFTKELIRERLTLGYRRLTTKKLGGYYLLPFCEKGLRSKTLNSVAAPMFVAATPKGSDIRTRWGDEYLTNIGCKLFALDQPYVEGNRKFLNFIRIDTDAIWSSYEACVEFFRQLARDSKIVCEPHFLVGLQLADGTFIRPHAIWMLPPGAGVWNEKGKEGFRRAPVDLYHSVYYGLCHALKDAGADAGAPATSMQVKNPLSPEWYTVCMQDSHFPSLSEHAESLELYHNRDTLTRQQASVQSGLVIEESNAIFNYLQKAAYSIMTSWHFNADPEFLRMRHENRVGAIADRLHIELERVAAQEKIKPSKKAGNISYLIATVSQYAAGKFDPDRIAKKKSNKGAALHLVAGVKTVKERKQVGGSYAAKQNADRVKKIVFDALIKANDHGYDINKSSIAKIADVSRTTVHKYWNEALAKLAMYIESKDCAKQSMIKRIKTIRTTDLNKITSTTLVSSASRTMNIECKVSDTNFDNDNGIIIRERVRNSYSEMRMKC